MEVFGIVVCTDIWKALCLRVTKHTRFGQYCKQKVAGISLTHLHVIVPKLDY